MDIGSLMHSKYLTIYQFLTLSVTHHGMTVREALLQLDELVAKSDNEAAEQNLNDVMGMFKDIVADGLLDNDSPMAQSIILIKLELRLYESNSSK